MLSSHRADEMDAPATSRNPPPQEAPPSSEPAPADEAVAELPPNLEADFAPPKEAVVLNRAGEAEGDPYLRDSVLAQEVFDRAAVEADAGDEEDAVVHFLRASKL